MSRGILNKFSLTEMFFLRLFFDKKKDHLITILFSLMFVTQNAIYLSTSFLSPFISICIKFSFGIKIRKMTFAEINFVGFLRLS